MNKRFFQFIFLACACLMCALPAKADVNWASMGVIPTSGKYCIYNPQQGYFITTEGITNNLANVAFFDITIGTNQVTISYTDNSTTYYLGEPDPMTVLMGGSPLNWITTSYSWGLITPSSPTYSNSFFIESEVYDAVLGDTYCALRIKNDGSFALETAAESGAETLPASEWIFIPKATFESVVAVSTGGGAFYYIQNRKTKAYLTHNGASTDLNRATMFYVKKVTSGTYQGRYTIACSDSKSIKYVGNSSSVITNNPASDSRPNLELIEHFYNDTMSYYFKSYYNSDYWYVASNAAGTGLSNVKNNSATNLCDWIFIPSDSIKKQQIAKWEKTVDAGGDKYEKMKSSVPDAGAFYYLYNPLTKTFLQSGTSLGVGVQGNCLFYIKKDGDKYIFSIEKGDNSNVYYMYSQSSSTWSSATTISDASKLTLETTGDTKYYRILNKDNLYLTARKTNTTSYGQNFISGTSSDYYVYNAEADVNSYWVLIEKTASNDLAAPTYLDNDPWVEHAVAPTTPGLYYLYNPAAQRWMTSNITGVQNAANGAGAFYVSRDTETGKYTIVNANTSYGTTIRYVSGQNKAKSPIANAFFVTLTETEAGSKHYYLSDDELGKACYLKQYISSFNSTTGIPSNWSLNYAFYDAAYPFVPDGWCEWVFVPYAYHEAQIGEVPSSGESMADGGFAPQVGESYFLYNVEAKTFYGNGSALVADKSDAQVQEVIVQENGLKYKNVEKWVCPKQANPYSTFLHTLTIERVTDDENDPNQYYIYHNVNTPEDYDIYFKCSNSTATGPDVAAIKTNGRTDALSGKYKWVFLKSRTVYFSASTDVFAGEGAVHVALASNDLASAPNATGTLSSGSWVEKLPVKIFLKAVPASGYQFMGWKTDPEGEFISTNEAYFSYNSDDDYYTYDLKVSSDDYDHPDNLTLYAYFENKDAEVFDKEGISQGEYAALADAIEHSNKGYTIKLKRNITTAQTIDKGVTIDFNGYTISGTANVLVTVAPSTDTVTFKDGSIKQEGGVDLTYYEAPLSTLKNAINVISGTLVINSGSYTTLQQWSNQEGDAAAYVINRTGGNVRINGGNFKASRARANDSEWSSTTQRYIFNGSNIKLYGGYFGGNCDELKTIYTYNTQVTIPLVANNLSGLVGQDMELRKIDVADPHTDPYIFTVQSAFDEALVVATANGKKFTSLADAIAYANNKADTTVVIRLAKDCQLEAGNYVIPEKATLIVPYSSLHTEPLIACPLLNNRKLPQQAYRTLTLASGVHIDVYGVIELGGCAYSYGNGDLGTGRPNSDYGHLIMNEGSEIVLNNGANLRAWGFVTGDGTIDVRRGARVDEMFQVYDFKGGRGTLAMYQNGTHKAFPMNQYFIQNVEVKTTYRPGASLYTTMAAVNVGISVKIIGVSTDDAALFMMDETKDSEDTWVRKWYNPATDQQVYDINNSAAISNLFLPLSSVIGVQDADFDSKDYILPITNNFKIHVLAGEINITQDVAFLPGAELEIDKQCYGKIKQNTTTYFYDSDEWGNYVYNGAYGSKIKYRPDGLQYERDITAAGVIDAQMNVHGTLEVDGGFRTTEGGANIFSTNADAGTVSYTANSLTTYADEILDTWTHQVYHAAAFENDYKASADAHYIALPAKPAKLQNAEGFTSTTTAAVGDNDGKSFCYIDNEWQNLTDVLECLVYNETSGKFYAKPKEYVEVDVTVIDEPGEDLEYRGIMDGETNTHTFAYTSTLGYPSGDTVLIHTEDCQWWKVVRVPEDESLVYCPATGFYYYWATNRVDEHNDVLPDAWVEKRFSITWKNWDQSVIDTYQMKMGAKLQYLGSTPDREKTAYYTYDFAGWNPAIAEDAVVTGDATYTAQFNQTDRKYLITFVKDEVELETQYLCMGEIPSCEAYTPVGNEQWVPAISAVTGDQTYTLGTNDPAADSYEIRFVNWNGGELQSSDVANGEMPEYTGATPIKPSIGDEEYRFIGWTPALAAATANAVYVATFEAQKVTGLNITAEQTIDDTREVTDLRITTTGSLNITGSVTANNFILESNGSTASGQFLAGHDKLTYTHAYFDLKLNAKNHQWYAVAVPWPVNATNGISVNGKTLELGKDFDIIYYDGATRASAGKQKCWKYVEDDDNKTLVPGRLYMIGLMGDAQTVRFEKTTGALSTTTTSVTAYAQTTGDETDKGWNGVANPALFHAFVNPGVTEGQVYVPNEKRYETVTLNTNKFVVGEGAFVQVSTGKAITVTKDGAFSAPRRTRAQANLTYDVRIAPAEANYTDRLFIKTTDSKENVYTVGEDLAKVGVSSIVPQMWINRYNEKLCVNTAELTNETAEYPLGISVPANGEYTIRIQDSEVSDQYSVYLTLNNEAIWNLSDAPYTLDLTKGTTNAYGLRISAKAPQVVTGVDEAVVDAKGETKKVLINNNVYIIRGGEVYTVTGAKIQ